MPFITIGVPTFKRTDLLRETLSSILAQLGDHDYEVVVCDNGGLPETRALVAEFPASRFTLHVNNPPCSATENWSRCILLARSPWITVLHDDDLLFPWYLNTVVPYLKENVSAVFVLTEKGATPSLVAPRSSATPRISTYLPGYFIKNSMTAFPGVIFRRSLALEIGNFNHRLISVSDYLFWYRLSCAGRLVKVNTKAAFYRIHGEQSTNTVWPLFIREGHNLRLHIAREQFSNSGLSRWIARYFTYHNALGLSRRFSGSSVNLSRALRFKSIPFTWLPRGWVWALTKGLTRIRRAR
jgi:glycosyltransferase involved in cell wall biosynthesis